MIPEEEKMTNQVSALRENEIAENVAGSDIMHTEIQPAGLWTAKWHPRHDLSFSVSAYNCLHFYFRFNIYNIITLGIQNPDISRHFRFNLYKI